MKNKYHKEQLHYIDKYIERLERENTHLKEKLENDIDRYEDTISYQLGFDKGKEYMQQRIDKVIEFITEWEKETKEKRLLEVSMLDLLYIKDILGGNNE